MLIRVVRGGAVCDNVGTDDAAIPTSCRNIVAAFSLPVFMTKVLLLYSASIESSWPDLQSVRSHSSAVAAGHGFEFRTLRKFSVKKRTPRVGEG
jgi:hypothetical protein